MTTQVVKLLRSFCFRVIPVFLALAFLILAIAFLFGYIRCVDSEQLRICNESQRIADIVQQRLSVRSDKDWAYMGASGDSIHVYVLRDYDKFRNIVPDLLSGIESSYEIMVYVHEPSDPSAVTEKQKNTIRIIVLPHKKLYRKWYNEGDWSRLPAGAGESDRSQGQ